MTTTSGILVSCEVLEEFSVYLVGCLQDGGSEEKNKAGQGRGGAQL